ncbi:MAG: class I SAM-dependent methyltransferase [Methanobrevibacter sp.]|nr:class I SAM-dependent methyltransferase [Methanobrevibacter sp.]
MQKYGKEIDMRNLNRNLENIRVMKQNRKDASLKYLNEFNPDDEISCPICESGQYKYYVDIYGYKYCECQYCKSIFLANLPNAEELYQGSEEVAVEHYVDKEIFEKRKEIISKPKLEFVLECLNDYNGGGNFKINSWLDIGCATGELLSFVQDMGIKAVGIESDYREAEFARKIVGLEIIEGYIDSKNPNEEINNAVYDASVISFINVLEHIPNPIDFINDIYKYSNDDSILVFEVPRHPSLASFSNLVSHDAVYRHMVPPQHLQIFTEKGVDEILKDKYEIIGKWGFGQGFFDILTESAINADLDNLELYNQLIDQSNPIQKVIDEVGFSDTMIFVCKKLSKLMDSSSN